MAGGEGAADGVANLVVGDEGLGLAVRHAGALHAGDDAVDRVVNLGERDGLLAAAAGEDGRLVEKVGEVGAGEAGGALGDGLDVDVVGEALVLGVHLENLDAALDVGVVDGHLAIEATGAEEGGVEDVRAVGRRDDDDAGVALETVHLGEELVEGLLALVVAAADASTAGAAHGVDLIDEDDAGSVLLGLLEEVADAGGADADEHLDKLRAGDGEEGHASLAGNGLGEERLTGTGGTNEEHTLGDLGTDVGEALGALEELDNLHEVVLGLVDARDVVEGDAGVGLHLELRLGLAKRHGVVAAGAAHAAGHVAAAALVAAGQEEETTNEEEGEGEVAEEVEEHRGAVLGVGVRGKVDVLLAELGEELGGGAGELDADALDAVAELGGDSLDDGDGAVLVEVDLLDTAHVEVLLRGNDGEEGKRREGDSSAKATRGEKKWKGQESCHRERNRGRWSSASLAGSERSDRAR